MKETVTLSQILELCSVDEPILLTEKDGEYVKSTVSTMCIILSDGIQNSPVNSIKTEDGTLKIWIDGYFGMDDE